MEIGEHHYYLEMLDGQSFHHFCVDYLLLSLRNDGARVETIGHYGVDYKVSLPSGEILGVMLQTGRLYHESLQRTFEKKDQLALARGCSKQNLIPTFAFVFATNEEPNKIQVFIAKQNDLLHMLAQKGTTWLKYSQKEGIIIHFNTNKGYLKAIQSNPHVRYFKYEIK